MARTRSSAVALTALFSSCKQPIYVLSEQRIIVYCNAACAHWIGVDEAELIGLRCDYQSPPAGASENSAAAAALCPPPEAFLGQRFRGEVLGGGSSGSWQRHRAEFLPLENDAAQSAGLLVLVESRAVCESAALETDPIEDNAEQSHRRLLQLRREIGEFQIDQLVGQSPAIRQVRAQVGLAAEQQTSVVLVGALGSGREQIARSIHYSTPHGEAGPLAPLSCELLDAELLRTTLSSLLRRGVETEEEQPQPTLLLLEADLLSAEAQDELATAINPADFNLRILTTAKEPLLQLARRGLFRLDLACALSTLVIHLPSLAERLEDLPLLSQYVLELENAVGGRQLSGFTPEAIDQLTAHPWSGNFDEFVQVVRKASRQAEGPKVTASDLPSEIHLASRAAAYPNEPEKTIDLDAYLAEIEVELIRRALQRAKGNKAKAARLLGVSRTRLLRRLAHFEIE